MSNNDNDPAREPVRNGWLTPEVAAKLMRWWLESPALLETWLRDPFGLAAALPPLVLASEADALRDEAIQRGRDNHALRARVAELERELHDANDAFARVCAEVEELRSRPQPSAPNAGEAERQASDIMPGDAIKSGDRWYEVTGVDRHATGVVSFTFGTVTMSTHGSNVYTVRPAPAPVAAAAELTDQQLSDLDRLRLYSRDVSRGLYAVEAKRLVALIDQLRSRPAPAPDAPLTDAEIDALLTTWFGPASRSDIEDEDNRADMAKTIAKLHELRPQPARLRMPTVEGAYRLASDLWCMMQARETLDRVQAATHTRVVAFLRTLGAEIVEPGPDSAPVAKPVRFSDGRLLWTEPATPSPAREPEPDETLRDRFAVALAADVWKAGEDAYPYDCASIAAEVWRRADAMLAGRRRVEGEEVGK